MRTTAGAIFGGGCKIFKDTEHIIGIYMCEAKRADTGGIDNPTAGECRIGGEGECH